MRRAFFFGMAFFMLSGCGDGQQSILDMITGQLKQTVTVKEDYTILRGHTGPVWGLSYSPDGKTFASGAMDDLVILWDVKTLKQIFILKGHTDPVLTLRFSPDGKTLASAGKDNSIILWDTASGKAIKTLAGHTSWVVGLLSCPMGKGWCRAVMTERFSYGIQTRGLCRR